MNLSKQALRAAIREKKRAMDPADLHTRSEALCRMVLSSPAYRRAEAIYGYVPFNQEVDIRPLLHRALAEGKRVALPKCYGKELRFLWVTDLTQVRPSAFGAPEPVSDGPIAREKTALVLVPGLAFDRRGYRIGYGGGFYDRFLAQEPEHPTIALCYDFQLLPQLEAESHDIPVDTILYR